MRRFAMLLAGLAALAVATLSLTYLLRSQAPDPLSLPDAALEGMGAHLSRVTVTAWMPLQPGQDPAEDLDRVAAALQATPAPADERATAPGAGNERRAYTLAGQAGGALTLTLHRPAPATLAAVIELPAAAAWWDWRDRLTAALGNNVLLQQGTSPRIYTVLEYDAPGQRLWAARDTVARGVLRRLGARAVEGVSDGQIYSLTAFSPRLATRLWVAGRAVNTAVALHWDQASGQTRLWLGSPVINIEY
ncbi:MAG: YwmB family TATA-box binding protein [Symbiobacteriia bacterium]